MHNIIFQTKIGEAANGAKRSAQFIVVNKEKRSDTRSVGAKRSRHGEAVGDNICDAVTEPRNAQHFVVNVTY